ncbi:lysozyme inhibitor LprI family protein [Candidatus Ferrigenium straubiae]|jgi:uncharacterized protein|uniref:lysozyme inhibitor LprI family protein n=1 Tax=Candidatus Ferrigenium straubiae TaxID=2919506 RepID=UPI003F4ABCD6
MKKFAVFTALLITGIARAEDFYYVPFNEPAGSHFCYQLWGGNTREKLVRFFEDQTGVRVRGYSEFDDGVILDTEKGRVALWYRGIDCKSPQYNPLLQRTPPSNAPSSKKGSQAKSINDLNGHKPAPASNKLASSNYQNDWTEAGPFFERNLTECIKWDHIPLGLYGNQRRLVSEKKLLSKDANSFTLIGSFDDGSEDRNVFYKSKSACELSIPSKVDQSNGVKVVPSPSFNCAKAISDAEKLICSDAELAALDLDLSGLYKQAKENSGGSAEFKNETVREWKRRESDCHSKACLIQWYSDRRKQLQQWSVHKNYAYESQRIKYPICGSSKLGDYKMNETISSQAVIEAIAQRIGSGCGALNNDIVAVAFGDDNSLLVLSNWKCEPLGTGWFHLHIVRNNDFSNLTLGCGRLTESALLARLAYVPGEWSPPIKVDQFRLVAMDYAPQQ